MELTPKGQQALQSLKDTFAMPLTVTGLLLAVAIPIGLIYVFVHFVVKYW